MADFTYSTSTPNAQLSEEQRRRRLLEKLAKEYGGPIDEQTRRQLENKVRTVPLQQVDQELGYTPDARVAQRQESLNAGQAGVEEAQAKLAQRQQAGVDQPTPLQQQLFDLIDQKSSGQIDFAQYAQKWQALTGQQLPGATAAIQNQKKKEEQDHAKMLSERYGRKVGSEYLQSLQKAREAGMYDEDFKDNIFGAGAFNGARAASRRGWTKEDYAREYQMLNGKVDDFEKVRQQLTENFQRMDPFAKTQYNEMSKQIQGLERARANGQVRPIEYMRAMGQLADRSQQIKWKYHMRQPGQSPGEISNQNGMVMQMTQEGPKPIGLTPDYIQQNSFTGQDGNIYVPKLVKGEITYEAAEDKNADRIPDVMQMKELAKDYDDKVNEHFEKLGKAWMEANPLQAPSKTNYDDWMNEARAFVSQQQGFNAEAVRAQFDPQARQSVQQHIDSERQAIEQAKGQEMQQRAQQEVEMQKAQQQQQEQAVRQAAIEQKVSEGMDEAQASRLVDDDMYANKDRNAPGYARMNRAQTPLPVVSRAEQNAFRSMLDKAKTKKDELGIIATHWSKHPPTARKVQSPIPWRPETKPEENEVYLMPRKDKSGYDRLLFRDGKFVKIKMPEDVQKAKTDIANEKARDEAFMRFSKYAGI